MRIRLRDIARDLDLSTMTISRVLRGHADVSEQTKARVLQRVEELNFRPNVSARGLRTGQAFRVGVLVPRLDDPYFSAICQGLSGAFQEAGYGVAISTTLGDPEREDAEFEQHLSRHVDAVFLAGDRLVPASRQSSVPVFLLGRKSADRSAHRVYYNEPEIGRQAAAWLLARGARRIAYLRGARTAANDERFSGFLKAHREAHVPPRHEWAREARGTGTEYQKAYESIAALLRSSPAPDAVMANCDTHALGARDAALSSGMRIPEDLQVIGCGNDKALCDLGLPLTSVSFAGEELGARAARMALKSIAAASHADAMQTLRLSPSVVPRMTTRKLEAKAGQRRG